MATARGLGAGHTALTLDGVTCGFVDAVDGGDIFAHVVETKTQGSVFVEKHIGPPRYEDFVARIGLSMAQPIYDWIQATLTGKFARKDGSVTTADADLHAKAEQQFFHALVTGVGFPALDAAAKDAAYLTVTFSPELTRSAKASGKLPPPAAAKAKAWTRANFRLELGGIDCSHVKSIDAFSVQLAAEADHIGDSRELADVPSRLEFPNLRVTFADGPTAATWQTWFHDFVVNGKNGAGSERSGAIVYLAPDLKTELGQVVLHNVGIFALRHSAVGTLAAELYCDRMELVVGKPAPPAKPVLDKPAKLAMPVKPVGIER